MIQGRNWLGEIWCQSLLGFKGLIASCLNTVNIKSLCLLASEQRKGSNNQETDTEWQDGGWICRLMFLTLWVDRLRLQQEKHWCLLVLTWFKKGPNECAFNSNLLDSPGKPSAVHSWSSLIRTPVVIKIPTLIRGVFMKHNLNKNRKRKAFSGA